MWTNGAIIFLIVQSMTDADVPEVARLIREDGSLLRNALEDLPFPEGAMLWWSNGYEERLTADQVRLSAVLAMALGVR